MDIVKLINKKGEVKNLMAKKAIHVVPHSNGWAVKKDDAERASGCYGTKAEAEQAARDQARREGSELVIHGKDGRIQRRDSHGNDPYPPEG